MIQEADIGVGISGVEGMQVCNISRHLLHYGTFGKCIIMYILIVHCSDGIWESWYGLDREWALTMFSGL